MTFPSSTSRSESFLLKSAQTVLKDWLPMKSNAWHPAQPDPMHSHTPIKESPAEDAQPNLDSSFQMEDALGEPSQQGLKLELPS